MNCDKWLRYFESNRSSAQYIPWDDPLPERDPGYETLRALIPQLCVGEGTEGALGETLASQASDERYARCLRAYAQEETMHGRLLERLGQRYGSVPAGGGDLLVRLVLALVNLGPLLARVLMLYTGEVVIVVLYRRLREGSPDRVVKAVLQSLLCDERGHIAFHADRLRQVLRESGPRMRWWLVMGHRLGFALLCVALYLENRKALNAYGRGGFSSFVAEAREIRDRTSTGGLRVFRGRSYSGPGVAGPTPLETASR